MTKEVPDAKAPPLTKACFSLFTYHLVAVSSGCLNPTADKQADQCVGAGQNIAVTGFGSQDATITDTTGKDFTHAPNLSMYSVYTLTYHWRIPDEVVVKAGDTATFPCQQQLYREPMWTLQWLIPQLAPRLAISFPKQVVQPVF